MVDHAELVNENPLVYGITDWVWAHEVADMRRRIIVPWVAMPTKHDGKSYSRIAALPPPLNIEVLLGYQLIVETAAKLPEPGILMDKDGPIDAETLALKTRYPMEMFQHALDKLCDERIGWLTLSPYSELLSYMEKQRQLKKEKYTRGDPDKKPTLARMGAYQIERLITAKKKRIAKISDTSGWRDSIELVAERKQLVTELEKCERALAHAKGV